MNDLTLYGQLGVDKCATPEEIKVAFLRAATIHHPDKGGESDVMAVLNLAYTVLTNPKARARYDKELELLGEICPTCDGAGRRYKQKNYFTRVARPCEVCNGNGILRWKKQRKTTIITGVQS